MADYRIANVGDNWRAKGNARLKRADSIAAVFLSFLHNRAAGRIHPENPALEALPSTQLCVSERGTLVLTRWGG